MNQQSRHMFALGLSFLAIGAFTLIAAAEAGAWNRNHFILEVAQDGSTGAQNSADPPGRANVNLISGLIYPEGSIDPDGTTQADPIGTWRCLFANLGPDDPRVGAITYYFTFGEVGESSEHSMIIVQGLNAHAPPEQSVPRLHAVVGGTGRFSHARGQVLEVVTGFNPSPALNLRFKFMLNGRLR